MGEPIRIVDLVHSLAYVMKIPHHGVAIDYCGLRPGEKLDEELFFDDESLEKTGNPLVLAASLDGPPLSQVMAWLAELAAAVAEPARAAERLMEIATLDSGKRADDADQTADSGDEGERAARRPRAEAVLARGHAE